MSQQVVRKVILLDWGVDVRVGDVRQKCLGVLFHTFALT